MFDYRTYLLAAVALKLRDLCTPYTKIGDAVPEQCDNDDFWIAAESAVRSIHKDIRLDDFPPEAVGVIGPELCGPVAWP